MWDLRIESRSCGRVAPLHLHTHNFCPGSLSFAVKKNDKDNLQKKTFNLGAHDSKRLESMTIMSESMAADWQAGRWKNS